MKLLKISLAVVAVLVVGFAGLGYVLMGWTGELTEEAAREATAFAANANKDQCLDRYTEKVKACDGLRCYSSSAAFGVTCLSLAAGDSEEFCRGKPKSQMEFHQTDWGDGYCKPRNLDDSTCLFVFKIIEAHCS